MKNIRYYALFWSLVVSGLLVAGLGCCLKSKVCAPLELHQDADIMSLPFLFPEIMEPRLPAAETAEPSAEPTTVPTTEPPATQPPTETTEPPTTEPTEPPPPPPVFGQEESYFDDVLFIGDSRTVGLRDYCRLGGADYFCGAGMTLFSMFTQSAADTGFPEQDLETLLSSRQYGKIYICLGLNEAYYDLDGLREKYTECIEKIRALQPDSLIVLQSIMTLGRGKAASEPYFSLERLDEINSMISSLADGESVFFVDVNPVIADEEGYLPDEYSSDGCHLYAKYYDIWAKFLCDSAIPSRR